MKILEQSILIILKLLLNTQIIWMIRFYPVVAELFIRNRKLNIPLAFITQSYIAVPRDIRLDCTYYFIMKISNKRELEKIAFNHSSDIDFQDFMNL